MAKKVSNRQRLEDLYLKAEKTADKLIAFDQYQREFRNKIGIPDDSAGKTNGTYLKQHAKKVMGSKMKIEAKIEKLKIINKKPSAEVRVLYAGGRKQLQLNVAVQALIEIRESEKYARQVDSAIKRGFVTDEGDFFTRTVKKASRETGLSYSAIVDGVNIEAEKRDLEPVDGKGA